MRETYKLVKEELPKGEIQSIEVDTENYCGQDTIVITVYTDKEKYSALVRKTYTVD